MTRSWSRNIRDSEFFVNRSSQEKLKNFRARVGCVRSQKLKSECGCHINEAER